MIVQCQAVPGQGCLIQEVEEEQVVVEVDEEVIKVGGEGDLLPGRGRGMKRSRNS